MSEILRLYKYKSLLSGRRVLPAEKLIAQLEISRATLKRDLAKLRDQFHLPIRFDRDRGGYFLDTDNKLQELPGLWLDREDLAKLGAIQHVVAQLQPGVVGGKLDGIGPALWALLRKHGIDLSSGPRRTRILHARKRRIATELLDAVNVANVLRKKLRITHYNRDRGEATHRDVSPQKVILYRDNWYLAAWCHLRDSLRLFAIDGLLEARVLEVPCMDLDPEKVDESVNAAYGIFFGKPKDWAVLRFTPHRARWVTSEVWHSRQIARTHEDGSYELRIPFSDDRELIADILSYGADVVVVAPASLRSRLQKALLAAASRYVEPST